MPVWVKKVLVVLITVLTLGTVTPPAHLLSNDGTASTEKSDVIDHSGVKQAAFYAEESETQNDEVDIYRLAWKEIAASIYNREDLGKEFINYTAYQADVQMMEKFGPRISERLGDQYKDDILPKLEEVIRSLSDDLEEETLRYMVITDRPASGKGERVFHIRDGITGEDILRFHVRREHPPQQGYWFSFHYHYDKDNFEQHYELGKLYWDKNTPPNWMA